MKSVLEYINRFFLKNKNDFLMHFFQILFYSCIFIFLIFVLFDYLFFNFYKTKFVIIYYVFLGTIIVFALLSYIQNKYNTKNETFDSLEISYPIIFCLLGSSIFLCIFSITKKESQKSSLILIFISVFVIFIISFFYTFIHNKFILLKKHNKTLKLKGSLVDKDFSNLDLRNLTVVVSDLHRTKFMGSDLRNVNFGYSNLWDVKFKKADLRGADLTFAYIESADFDEAKINNKTKLPSLYKKENIAYTIKNSETIIFDRLDPEYRTIF